MSEVGRTEFFKRTLIVLALLIGIFLMVYARTYFLLIFVGIKQF